MIGTIRDGSLRPSDFPVGSPESRAAARVLLSRRIDTRRRITIAYSIPRRGMDRTRVQFDKWREWPNNTLGRFVYIPIVWLKPGVASPTCPACGTPFKKKQDFPNIALFEADCVGKHDPEHRWNPKTGRNGYEQQPY